MTKKKKVASKKPTKKTKTKKRPVVFSDSTDAGPPVERSREDKLRDQQAVLGVLAKAINASRDAQAQRDKEIEKLYEDEPMSSIPVWHVHTQ